MKENWIDISLPKMTIKRFTHQLFCKHFYKYNHLIIDKKWAYTCLYCRKQTLKKIPKDIYKKEYSWIGK